MHGDNLLSRLADAESKKANAANSDLAASKRKKSKQFNNRTKNSRDYGREEVRFTVKEDVLYVFVLNPSEGSIELPALGLKSKYKPKQIRSVQLVGSTEKVQYEQTDDKLILNVPAARPTAYAAVFEITGAL